MNFLIKKVVFFSLLVFTLVACEKPGDIGLEIKNPGQSFGVLYTDTLTVQTSTVLVDSVRTSRSSDNAYILAGQYNDPQLGAVTASSFFGLYPATATIDLGESPVADSVVLFLRNSYVYGDTNAVQSLTLYSLQDSIQNTTVRRYYNTDNLSYSSMVGTAQSRPSARAVNDTLRILLKTSVGDQLTALNGQNEAVLKQSFYGFAMVPQGGSNGAVVGFNASSSATRLRLYYHNAASATTQKIYDFGIDPEYTFNQLTSDKNGPWVNLAVYQPLPSAATSQETLVEGGIGIMTKIDIPYLQRLKTNQTIRLNQAYLIVQPVQSKTGGITPPPSDLILYRSDPNGRPLRNSSGIYIPIEDNISPTVPRLSSYNATDNSYRFNITQYLQRILDSGEPVTPSIYLSLPSFSLDAYYPRNSSTGAPTYIVSPAASLENSVSRLILGNQQHPANALKLQLYYTEIK